MSQAKQKFDAAMAQFVGQSDDKRIHLYSMTILRWSHGVSDLVQK